MTTIGSVILRFAKNDITGLESEKIIIALITIKP